MVIAHDNTNNKSFGGGIRILVKDFPYLMDDGSSFQAQATARVLQRVAATINSMAAADQRRWRLASLVVCQLQIVNS